MNIRLTQPTTDTTAIFKIHQLLHPEEQLTLDLFKKCDSDSFEGNEFVRFVGELDNQIIAYGSYWHSPSDNNDTYRFTISVHPNYQNTEAVKLMHDYLLTKLAEVNPSIIVSEPKEDELHLTQLLEDSNFNLKMRFPRSQLNLKTFDFSTHDEVITGLQQQGIKFVTLADAMKSDSNWQRNIWHLFNIIDQDVPYPNPQESVPFETYATYYEGELFRPESWTLALDTSLEGQEQYIGMAVVNIMPTRPDTVYAGITGVIPSHRRRKIATMLKVCSARYAKQQGYSYIYTDNEENNPMYALNIQLGFEPLPAWVYYERTLDI